MAIKSPPPAASLLTYEQYLEEGTIEGSYEIIDGVRYPMSGASWPHQRIVINLLMVFDLYRSATGNGEVLAAPFDVLIRRNPLRVRPPDVFFISHAQLAKGGGIPEKGVLEVAPELIVEVISDTETPREIESKLADYCAIGVKEGWLVRRATRTVEVLRLTPNGPELVATYGETQSVQSLAFPDLSVPVAEIFKS